MTQQALVLEKPGVWAIQDSDTPVPGPGEVLVRVHRVGVCGTDWHAFAGRQPFFTYPRILGHELGVEVLDTNGADTDLRPGDRCAVEPYINCGHCPACRRGAPNCCENLRVLGVHSDGGLRPVIAVPARKLHKSATLSYEALALVETLAIGAHAVERAAVQRGDFILVIGAGPIGLSVIETAKAIGARMSVMDTSEARLGFARKVLGIACTVNPTTDDSLARLREFGGGELPVTVFDATGNAKSMEKAFEYPAHAGKLVFVGLVQGTLTFDDPAFHKRELTLFASRNALPGTFTTLIRRIEAGEIDTAPWITHRIPFLDVPTRFQATAQSPDLLKAMIQVT